MIALILNRFRNGWLIARLVPAYLILGLLKHVVPLSWLARWAWCAPDGPRDREAERRLAVRVFRLSQLIGLLDRDCLHRSLLLYRVLSRAGADPRLVIGFQRMNGRILGHAWVIVEGHAVIEPEINLLRFSPALGFGFEGAPLSVVPEPEINQAGTTEAKCWGCSPAPGA
jgi:hypothetical protein